MNKRSPNTPGGAFTEVKDTLGAKVLARILDVSEWTIYDRCDAQEFSKLNISFAQAHELDRMCKEKTGRTPLAKLNEEWLDEAPAPAKEATFESVGLKLASEVGQVEEKILSIRQDGRGLSNRKGVELLTELRDVKRCVDDLENLVEKETGAA